MQVEARFRRRVPAEEDIFTLNQDLLNQLSKIDGLWAESKPISDAFFDPGSGESASTNLSPCLGSKITGGILYASRYDSFIDRAISDDSIILEFDSDMVNFKYFSNTIFPLLVKAFSPYRATIITDIDQDLDDFEKIVQEAQDSGLDHSTGQKLEKITKKGFHVNKPIQLMKLYERS
jgi:hypothetical protein